MNIRALLILVASVALTGVRAAPAHAEDLQTVPDIRLQAIHWVPRGNPPPPPRQSSGPGSTADGTTGGFIEIHGGFFDRDNGVARSGVAGTRFGASFDGRVQLGVAVDWLHRSDRGGTLVGSTSLPGGGTLEQRLDTLRVSSDLLPALGFIEVSPFSAGPYVGIAGGYEALFLALDDYNNGSSYTATLDGWGWQYYGGLALPLSRQVRVNAEVFVNNGNLDRDVYDPKTGAKLREVIDVGGAGARFGLSWRF